MIVHRLLSLLLATAMLFIPWPVSAQPRVAPVQPLAFGSGLAVCATPYQPVTLVNPTVISGASCTRAGLQAALDLGGHIRLDCGALTIPVDVTLQLNPAKDTVLDGGGLVTLDGLNQHRILYKGWHDPARVSSVTVTIQNIRLVRGHAPAGTTTGDTSGGAIQVGHPGTRLHVINAAFEDNATSDTGDEDNMGGAIFAHNAYETVIAGSYFRNNSAGNGGAIGAIASGMWIENSLFENNHAVDTTAGGIVRGYGGVLHLDGVYNDYNPNSSRDYRVCGSRFTGNTAYRAGGALAAVVSDNAGTRAVIDRSTFTANEVYGLPKSGAPGDYDFGQGGAIYHVEDDRAGGSNEDNFEIRDSTFNDNRARKTGGAVWLTILGRGFVINSTFSGNRTTVGAGFVGQGGALWLGANQFTVANTTFTGNLADFQGGALFAGGSNNAVTLANSIFVNNTLTVQGAPWDTRWQGYHTNRTMLDGGQNIQYPRLKPGYNNDVNNLITANPIYSDPLLAGLADNGGPTLTHALQPGSPAINTANPATCPERDQRGYLRQSACDIGPFEMGGQPFVFTSRVFLPGINR